MKRIMIWLGSILLLTVVAVVALVLLLPFILDPNDYKEKIETLAFEKSGYQLHIPGDINFQITPGLDVLFSLGQIQVDSTAAFPDVILFRSEEARIAFSIMPLLREKRLVIQDVKLHGVYCNLIRNSDGIGNWELSSKTIPAVTTKKQAPQQPSSQAEHAKKPTAPPAVDLGTLELSRISLRYEDKRTNKQFELKDFSVQTGRVQSGLPFHLQSAFTLISSGDSNATISVHTSLESDVSLNLATKFVNIAGFRLQSKVNGFGLQETELTLAFDATLDLAKKDIGLKDLSLESGALKLQLNAEITDYANPAFHGKFSVPVFSLRQFLADNKVNQPQWKDEAALTQVGFSCDFSGTKKKITVSDMTVLLDGAQAKGHFVLIDPEHPVYEFTMNLDLLDLDRYATVAPIVSVEPESTPAPQIQASKPQAPTEQTPQEQVALQPVFPVEMLKGLQFKLDLGATAMKAANIHLSNIQLKAEGKDGLLKLQPFQAELYEGSVAAEATLDVRGSAPLLHLQEKLNHVQIGPLLKDMTGKEDLTGTADLDLQIKSHGNYKKQLIGNTNGTMNLSFADGVIKKLQILQVIRQAKALYEGENVVGAAEDEPTGFALISASGVITDGVFVNADLSATSDLMKVTGSGKVDLGEEYVDYLLNVSLTRALDRNEKSGKTDFSKFVIPYRIQGKFSDLKEEADLAGLLKSQAQDLLVNELQKHLKTDDGEVTSDKNANSTQKLLEQGLKSLFGN